MPPANQKSCLVTGLSIPECCCVSCTRRLLDLPDPQESHPVAPEQGGSGMNKE
jgi:hypothetical protein